MPEGDQQYRQLNGDATYTWVRKLSVKNDMLAHVMPLLQSVKQNDCKDFVTFVEDAISAEIGISNEPSNLKAYEGGTDLPELGTLANFVLQPGSMNQMPGCDILSYFRHLRDLPFEVATNKYFWGAFTLQEIREQRIEPIWLVFDNHNDLGKAINGDEKTADRMMRRVIRSLTAPGLFRGAPELYCDCSLAKAWWCGKIATDCAKILGKKEEDTVEALAKIWNTAATYLAGTLTVIREPNITSALVLWSMESSLPTSTKTKEIILSLGEFASYNLICFSSPKLILGQIRDRNPAISL